MRKLVKAVLCLFLCALLSLPALAEVVAASKPLTNGAYMTSGEYTYTLLEGGACIIDYTGDAEALAIPAELDGHLVRQIGDRAFCACFALISATLPEGLTTIGDNAFFSCGLTSIALPDSLAYHGHKPVPQLFLAGGGRHFPRPSRVCAVLYEKASKTLVCYPSGKADDSFSVPEGTLSIAKTPSLPAFL